MSDPVPQLAGRPKRLRRFRLAVIFTLALGLLAAVWVASNPLDGYGVSPKTILKDELLGAGVAEPTDWAPNLGDSENGRETSSPVDLDGQQGTICQGWYANGNRRYEEHWLNRKHHGRETWWNDQGQRMQEQNWKAGYLQGPARRWYENGQLAEEMNYDHFLLDGSFRAWFRDGQPSIHAGYKSGLRDGKYITWHPKGKKHCQATFKDDRLHGDWQMWDKEGKLVKEVEYRDGQIVSESPQRRKEPFGYPGPLGSADFSFSLAQGGGLQGFNILRVSAAGRCEFRYQLQQQRVATADMAGPYLKPGGIYSDPTWRKSEFSLTEEEQRHMRDAIAAANLLSRSDDYVNKRIVDGTQWIVRLLAGGKEKRTYCSNRFPGFLRQLSRTLGDRIMAPHRMEVLTATGILKADQEEDEWLEDNVDAK